jgi:hypothetical protein
MSKVFLSHSSTDKTFVRKLAADLRASRHTVWIDEAEINVGDSLIGKIRDGIDSVDYVAAVLSKTSIQSEWVKKELEIASNREIKEKRVIVLPILVDKVDLPGFLEGKLYADFTDLEKYDEKLELLRRSLGDNNPKPTADTKTADSILEELQAAKELVKQYQATIKQISEHNFQEKSPELQAAIKQDNEFNPEYAPINNVYAFEANYHGVSTVQVTLGYLFHAMRKASYKGGHMLELYLSNSNKWDSVDRMLKAYEDMVLATRR